MSDETPRTIIPSQSNVIKDAVLRIKLIGRLMTDRRVSPWVKLIPVGALAYLIWPLDLIAGIPGVSALDDIGILSLAAYTFVEFCPTDVVMEHVRDLLPAPPAGKTEAKNERPADTDIIDGQATDVE